MTYPFDSCRGITPEISEDFKAECANRMRILNRLKAAPGQPNRAVVKDYLYWKKWITGNQEPEEWALFALPKDEKEYTTLSEELMHFEQSKLQQDLKEELL